MLIIKYIFSKFKREKVHLILVLIQLKTGAEEMKSLLKAKTKPFIKDNSKFEIS